MEILLIVLSIFFIGFSIKGIGLRGRIRKTNRILCGSVLTLGSLFSFYTGNGDIIVIFLKSLHIAAICLLITGVSWTAQIITNIISYRK